MRSGASATFGPCASRALALADQEAKVWRHEYIGSEHILVGIVAEGSGARALAGAGVGLDAVRAGMERHVKRGPRLVMVWKRPRTPRVEHIIGLAAREAESLGHSKVGTGHLLLGVLGDCSCAAAAVLAELGVDFGIVRERVLREIGDAASGEPRGVRNERGEKG